MKTYYKSSLLLVLILVCNACATIKKQVAEGTEKEMPTNKEIEHSFYLIGDAGNSDLNESSEALKAFKIELENAYKEAKNVKEVNSEDKKGNK